MTFFNIFLRKENVRFIFRAEIFSEIYFGIFFEKKRRIINLKQN